MKKIITAISLVLGALVASVIIFITLVPQDIKNEANLEAAERGDARSQFIMGQSYSQGDGVLQDYAEAVKWYRKAAEQGHAGAQNNLGVRFANGQGVPQDSITAHVWFNIAARNGSDKAQENRDELAKFLSSADLTKARDLARKCVESDYRDCP